MGEIFRHEPPAHTLEFTGERWTTAAHGQIEIEHIHRYLLARDFSRGKDVLDIACGEGYGTALLAQVARSVIGVDIDGPTVSHAATQYIRPNLHYVAGDARAIPLATASIDVVISFETLEHFAEQEMFLAELRRVMRPGGLLVISTPDSDVYSPVGAGANTYHLRELSREEFVAFLSRDFRHVIVSSQRALVGSAIVPRNLSRGQSPAVTFERRDDRHLERSDGLPRAVYLLACASDQSIAAPVGPSLYIHSPDADQPERGEALAEIRRQADRQADQIVKLARERDAVLAAVESARQDLADREAEIARLGNAVSHAEEDMWQRAGAAETMQAEITLLRDALSEAEGRLRHNAEDTVRIRAEIAELHRTVDQAMRTVEDAATMQAEIASLEGALATARRVGRAALDAMANGQAAAVPAERPVGWWQVLRRMFDFQQPRASQSDLPNRSAPRQVGKALPARAPR
jgi:2-polyprenyl-3-methyl-5-hydroxy-6-metoxy-1,4-benzoquinol methylase